MITLSYKVILNTKCKFNTINKILLTYIIDLVEKNFYLSFQVDLTVFHFHCHIIPRYNGDMKNPRGGVRHCVEGKGYYKVV